MSSAQDTTVAYWSQGRPMLERLCPPPGPAPTPAAAGAGARRLRRWREQEPFGDHARWLARLRAEGVDEATLHRLLAEPGTTLSRRLAEPDWSAWAGRESGRKGGSPPAPVPAGTGETSPFFARAARPLLDAAYARLRTALARRCASHRSILSPDLLLDQLFPSLTWRVHAMLIRTLTLELHLARLAGELRDQPERRFAEFLDRLEAPNRREHLLATYPVLGRQLWLAAEQWIANGARLAERIATDHHLLGRHFADGAPIGAVCQVRVGAGDRHRGGQSVTTVGFDSGVTVVYKPRSLAVDGHFAGLLDWLNAAGLSLPLRVPASLDRGEYGWTEFIVPWPCRDDAEIGRFYRRQGALLALLELLRANDMHAQNLIAAGEHPVLVDLETLLQPALPLDQAGATAAEHRAAAAARTSVLHVGLLPVLAWQTRDGRAVDLSGLGSPPGRQTPMSLPVLAGAGTDTMRVRLERVPMDLPDHRPVIEDTELNLLDYAGELVDGYTEMHTLCRTRRDDLLAEDGPLARFRGDPVRVLVRSTVTYATLLSTGFHPDVLRDGLDRDRHFDFLWRQVAATPALAAVVPAECRDLWRNDVPYLTGRTDAAQLFDSDRQPIPGFPVVPALDLVRRDLLARDQRHLLGQLDLIRGSLAAAASNATDQVILPSYRLPSAAGKAGAGDLVAAAEAIAAKLAGQAFVDGGSAQWLGLSSQGGRNWTLGPLGPDLFNGLAGVALFLATLGRRSRQRRYTDLARQTVATVRSQLEREPPVAPAGMSGLPGVVYALCLLARLLDDESLIDQAAGIAAGLRGPAADDVQYDVVSGSAGTIAAMRALHATRPDGPAAELVAAAADRLLATAQPHPPGCGWLPASIADQRLARVPLAGFGHGNAGIAWALEHAAEMLGDGRYAQLAGEAVAYERSLFDPAQGGWRDVRLADQRMGITAWCHGAVGIGLARLDRPRQAAAGCGPAIGDPAGAGDIDAALAVARRDGFGTSHCLCHGDTGTVELLLTAATVLGRPQLRAEADQRAAQILASIRADGEVCGVPLGHPTPSLMVGLAGIGYGLLRAAAPERVPAVLLLAPEPDGPAGTDFAASECSRW